MCVSARDRIDHLEICIKFEENACDLYMSHLICLDVAGLRTL